MLDHECRRISRLTALIAARCTQIRANCGLLLIFRAFLEGTESFIKYENGKKRLITKSAGVNHKELDCRITKKLKKHTQTPHRKQQSRIDLNLHLNNEKVFIATMDLVEGFNLNILSNILIFNFLFNPLLITIITIPTFILFKKNKMCIGLSTSQFLLGLTFKNIESFKFKNTFSQVYIDDLIIASNSRVKLYYTIYLYRFVFFILGFKFHKSGEKYKTIDLRRLPKKTFSRLGLNYGYNQQGTAYSHIRHKTIKKYKRRIIKILTEPNYNKETKVILIQYILFKGKNSIHQAFPREIWIGDAQRKKFNSWLKRALYYYGITQKELYHA